MKKIIAMLCAVTALVSGCSKQETDNTVTVMSDAGYDSLSAEGHGWGFVRKKGEKPELPSAQVELLRRYNGEYLDDDGGKTLYLTFDEGYENGFTAVILDILAKTKTPAAFFVTGPYLEGQNDLVKRMIDEGHVVGNHTVNHLNLPKQPPQTVEAEIAELNSLCESMYGYKMKYMRPPEGEFSEKSLAVTNDLGMKTVMWSFAYKDWDINAQKGADYAYQSVMPYLHDGAVILLHAVSSDNASALERIITDAQKAGYTFKSLDEL